MDWRAAGCDFYGLAQVSVEWSGAGWRGAVRCRLGRRTSSSWKNVYLHVTCQKNAYNSCILQCFTDVSREIQSILEIYIFLKVEIPMVSRL